MKKVFLKEEEFEAIGWFNCDNQKGNLLKYPPVLEGDLVQTGYTILIKGGGGSIPFGADCGLFSVVAYVHDENSDNFGKLVKYQTKLGDIFTEYISDDELISNTKALMKLVRKGYVLSSNTKIIQYLQDLIRSFDIEQFIPYSNQTGYYKSFHGFVLPDGLYTSEGKHAIVYDSNANNALALAWA